MSLMDALLVDPYQFEIWIATRSDGIAGSGTLNDPFRANTATELDGILGAIQGPMLVHFGPGTFETKGYYEESDGAPHGWQIKARSPFASLASFA